MKGSWRLFTLLLLGLVVLATVASALDDADLMRAMGDEDDEDDAMDVSGASGGPPEAAGDSKADEPAVINPKGQEKASGYIAPEAPGAIFVEDFQSGLGKWTYSAHPRYSGRFEIGQGAKPAFPGDRGLIIPLKARHYAMTAPIHLENGPEDDFALQYEVRMDDGMTCGGAYLKLPTDGETGFKSCLDLIVAERPTRFISFSSPAIQSLASLQSIISRTLRPWLVYMTRRRTCMVLRSRRMAP
jgi:hypothetical protein